MLSFKPCVNVPVRGGRAVGSGGGLVEMDGSIVWGGGYEDKQVYIYDEGKSQWSRMADGGERGARLAVCEGSTGVGRSVCGDGMVVMGGAGDGMRELNDVQVFDGKTQTWHRGPSLPQPCWAKSAVVHGDKVFVMGGDGMAKAVWCADIHDLSRKTTLRKALLGDADASKLSSTPEPSTNVAEMCGQVIVERILATKDVKRLIREAAKTDEWSKVLSALRIPDKPMLLIQVIDGDDLEKPVPVEYQPKDNAGKHKWNDKYVVKECIFHALSSLASSAMPDPDKVKNNQFCPQVLLVGTYKDELPGSEDDKKAAVQRCNQSIVDWVRQTTTFRKAIDVTNNEHTLVTDISNLEPNDVRNIKKKIEAKMLERELQSIPARLLVFDFILHKHAVNRKIRKVEKTEYEEIAKLCGIESDEIEKTLNYLHHKVGTLLYYPKITELKQCVIVDFQLIFDSVSNIIVKHFVNTEVQTSTHDKGQFEVSVLKEIECCLSIEELIALLKHRQVISSLGDGKFFMPSVLTKTETKPADASSCSFLLFF
eukprot:Em0007g187a